MIFQRLKTIVFFTFFKLNTFKKSFKNHDLNILSLILLIKIILKNLEVNKIVIFYRLNTIDIN